MPSLKLLQARIARHGDPQKKTWWEGYVKHNTVFLGVGLHQVEKELTRWYRENSVATLEAEKQLEMALYLFAQQHTEEKLAGILFLQKYLCRKFSWQELLEKFTQLFAKRLIYDWSTCDWFCLRVLRQLLDLHGLPCARKIAAWRTANYVWQARSSTVPFVGRTDREKYRALILPSCHILIRREERFAKTTVGWIMREFSKTDKRLVIDFLAKNKQHLTREVVTNALKYYPEEQKQLRKASAN